MVLMRPELRINFNRLSHRQVDRLIFFKFDSYIRYAILLLVHYAMLPTGATEET